MKPKFRVILEQALSEGIVRGYRRAHKHSDDPPEHILFERIQDEIMNSFYDYFDFEDEVKDTI